MCTVCLIPVRHLYFMPSCGFCLKKIKEVWDVFTSSLSELRLSSLQVYTNKLRAQNLVAYLNCTPIDPLLRLGLQYHLHLWFRKYTWAKISSMGVCKNISFRHAHPHLPNSPWWYYYKNLKGHERMLPVVTLVVKLNDLFI